VALGKQAKTLSKGQAEAMLAYLATTRWPSRNRVIFLLSIKAGLRAKEIAGLTWWMVYDSSGEIGKEINLQDSASKGKSGRVIPMNAQLREALLLYREEVKSLRESQYVIRTERSLSISAAALVNQFQRWYQHQRLYGCSSHSGRRTFLTQAARRISTVGGSLRDVQMLAGHSNLRTTQRYIEANPEAQTRIVDLI
jgi:integrase